jgi:hypothetical protein
VIKVRRLVLFIALVLTAVALASVPTSAAASVRLGPDLTTVQNGLGYGCQVAPYTPCSYVNLRSTNSAIPVAAPFDGVVTKWRFRAGCCTDAQTEPRTMTLKSFQRGVNDELGGYGYIVAQHTGPSFVIPPGSQVIPDPAVELPARMSISAGERIGIVADNPIAFASYAAPEVTLTIATNGTEYMGQQYGVAYPAVLAINAELEPDGDHDGYGDETQDCQPTDPTLHETCATVPLPPPPGPLNVFKPGPCTGSCGGGGVVFGSVPQGIPTPRGDGGVVVELACPPNATAPCGGILYAELPPGKSPRALASAKAGKLLAKAEYKVRPGKKKELSLKFSKKTIDILALKRTRKVTVTVRPAGGKAITKSVTLHFKKAR